MTPASSVPVIPSQAAIQWLNAKQEGPSLRGCTRVSRVLETVFVLAVLGFWANSELSAVEHPFTLQIPVRWLIVMCTKKGRKHEESLKGVMGERCSFSTSV